MAASPVALVPNVLSSLRLLLAVLFWAVPVEWRLLAVVAGGLSDALDGFIARRFAATSVAGGLLDGLADKALTLSVLLVLAADGTIRWWQVALVLVRDAVVLALATTALCRRRLDAFAHMPAKAAGKVATIAVFGWFVLVLAPVPEVGAHVLFGVAALASVVAGADYVRAYRNRPEAFRSDRPE